MRYPEGQRWCKECKAFLPKEQFPTAPGARCHPHWLVYNREKRKAHSDAHPGYDTARAKRWREKNSEKVQENNSKTYANQKAQGFPAIKAWRAANQGLVREYENAYGKKWREENPEKFAAQRHRKRARKAKAPGQHNYKDLLALTEKFQGHCVYCPEPATTWDHVLPFWKGGSNFAWNLAPACRSCNSRKQLKDVEAFLLQCPDATPEGVTYVKDAKARGLSIVDPERYVKNRYEKVSLGSLWDEVRRVHTRDELVTEAGLNDSAYSFATYLRRIGTCREMNEKLDGRVVDGRSFSKRWSQL